MATYFITRHAGTKDWVEQEGVRPGDFVPGTLPANLAAEVCARAGRYFHLAMNQPKEERGKELTAEDRRRYGAMLEAFRVEAVGRKEA